MKVKNIYIQERTSAMSRIAGLLTDAEAKLDEWGKGAWIATMVLGFVFFWPVGLLILGYMIWSGRMGCSPKKSKWRKRRSSVPSGGVIPDGSAG